MTPVQAWLCLGGLALATLLVLAALAFYWRAHDLELLGPLFWHEIVLLVRRPALFVVRTCYLLVLLFLLGLIFLLETNDLTVPWWQRLSEPVVPVTTMASFSQDFFLLFAGLQFLFLGLVTIRISAAAVAEDRDRKRLDFLLTTPLANHEIVLGKFAARLAIALLLALAALPVLSLLPFFGGVEPGLIVAAALFTFVTMVSLAALSSICSVYASTTTKAVDSVVQILFLYHVFSTVPYGIALAFPATPSWVRDLIALLNSGNLIICFFELFQALEKGEPLDAILPVLLLRYALFHLLVVFVCCRVAVTRLRTACRANNEGRVDPLTLSEKERKNVWPVDRPPVSDEPLLWKSIYLEDDLQPRPGQPVLHIGKPFSKKTEQTLRRAFFVGSLLVPLLLAGAASLITRDHFADALHGIVRGIATIIGCIVWMRMAGHANATVAGEREQRTLQELFVTSLERRAILQQKWRGAVRLAYGPMLWVACLGLVGVLCGSLHVLALPLFLALWLVYAVLFVNVALWFSVISPTKRVASRRLFLTIAITFVTTLILFPVFAETQLIKGLLASVCAPLVVGGSAASPEEVTRLFTAGDELLFYAGVALGVGTLGVVAAWLWQKTLARFETENAETVMSS